MYTMGGRLDVLERKTIVTIVPVVIRLWIKHDSIAKYGIICATKVAVLCACTSSYK